LIPVRQVQLGNGGRAAAWEPDRPPAVGDEFQEPPEKAFTQFLSQQFVKITVPQQREEHLSSNIGFGGESAYLGFCRQIEKLLSNW